MNNPTKKKKTKEQHCFPESQTPSTPTQRTIFKTPSVLTGRYDLPTKVSWAPQIKMYLLIARGTKKYRDHSCYQLSLKAMKRHCRSVALWS